MSISAETARIQYTLTSTGQTLAVPFYFLASADLKVVKTDPDTDLDTTLTLTTDYSVANAGNPAGGSVTLEVAAGAIDDIITIYRNDAITQPASYPSTGQFPSATTEQSQDRLTMLLQQLKLEIERCLRVPISSDAVDPFTKASRKGKLVGFDKTSGDPELVATADITSEVVKLVEAQNLNAQVGIFTPEQFGAVGDNLTDDSAAIQRAIDHIATLRGSPYSPSVLSFACKDYYLGNAAGPAVEIASAVILRGNGARLRYEGTGRAVRFNNTFNCVAEDLTIYKTGYSYASAMNVLAGSGLVLRNSSFNTFKNIYIIGFQYGLGLIGDGAGTSYNTFTNCSEQNCNYGVSMINVDAVGSYVTHNTFLGGTITIGPFVSYVGSRGIYGKKANRTLDGNKFYGMASEGPFERKLYYEGTDSAFRDIYWDQPNGGTDIEFTATTERNIVDGGATMRIMVVIDAGSQNLVIDPAYTKTAFTPVIEGITSAGVGTYTTQVGFFSKIGRTVNFSLRVAWSAHTGTGNMRVAGFLFPAGTTPDLQPCSIMASNLTFSGQLCAAMSTLNTYANLYSISTGGAVAGVTLDTSGELWLSGSYLTD